MNALVPGLQAMFAIYWFTLLVASYRLSNPNPINRRCRESCCSGSEPSPYLLFVNGKSLQALLWWEKWRWSYDFCCCRLLKWMSWLQPQVTSPMNKSYMSTLHERSTTKAISTQRTFLYSQMTSLVKNMLSKLSRYCIFYVYPDIICRNNDLWF